MSDFGSGAVYFASEAFRKFATSKLYLYYNGAIIVSFRILNTYYIHGFKKLAGSPQ